MPLLFFVTNAMEEQIYWNPEHLLVLPQGPISQISLKW